MAMTSRKKVVGMMVVLSLVAIGGVLWSGIRDARMSARRSQDQ